MQVRTVVIQGVCLVTLTAAAGCSGAEPGASTGGAAVPRNPDAVLSAPAAGEGFQIDEGDFTLAAGREGLFCEKYPIPTSYGDGPLFLRGVESRLPTGTHHFFMSYGPEALPAPTPCAGKEPLLQVDDPEVAEANHNAVDGKLTFTAAVGKDQYFLPDGYALYLASGAGHFTTSHHVLNLEEQTEALYGVFNVYTAKPEVVHHPVNVVNCTVRNLSVPAHAEADVGGTCTVPFDADLVVLSSHAHQHLTRFQMQVYDGKATLPEVVYESTKWDSPKILPLAEPLALKKGQGLTFTCHFANPGDEEITYGVGDFKEMCAIMSAFAYPKDRADEVPPTLGGVVFTNGEVTGLVDTTGIGGNF